MAYQQSAWKNFLNSYANSNDQLYKVGGTGASWNAKAQAVIEIPQYQNTVGVRLPMPSTVQRRTFAFGISDQGAFTINSIADLKAGFLIQTGPNAPANYPMPDNDMVKIISGGNFATTAAPIPNTYDAFELYFNIHGDLEWLGLTATGVDEYTVADQFEIIQQNLVFPQKVYLLLYDTFDAPITIDVNPTGFSQTAIINTLPDLNDPVATVNPSGIILEANNPLDGTTITSQNIKFEKLEVSSLGIERWDPVSGYIVNHSSSRKIAVLHSEELTPETTYRIILNNIKDMYGYELGETLFEFETVLAEVAAESIIWNTNTQDVYYKTVNLRKILDIDYLYSNNSLVFNNQYHLTVYNPETGEYEVQDTDSLGNFKASAFVDNQLYMQTLLENQYLESFFNYFKSIRQETTLLEELNFSITDPDEKIPTLSREEQEGLKLMLLRNIRNINMFKGTETEMDIVLSIYASSLNYHISSVTYDPYDFFVYRASSTMPQKLWDASVKGISHPIGWEDLYFYIPSQFKISWQLKDMPLPELETLQRFYDQVKEGDDLQDVTVPDERFTPKDITRLQFFTDVGYLIETEYQDQAAFYFTVLGLNAIENIEESEFLIEVDAVEFSEFKGRTTITYLEIGYYQDVEGYNFFNYKPTFNESGAIIHEDLMSEYQSQFRHNDYDVTLNYNHPTLLREIRSKFQKRLPTEHEKIQMVMNHVGLSWDDAVAYVAAVRASSDPTMIERVYAKLPLYELTQDKTVDGKSKFDLKFNKSGIAAEYLWRFMYNGVQKFTKRTYKPQVSFTEASGGNLSYSVELELIHDGWSVRSSPFVCNNYIDHKLRKNWERVDQRCLDVKALDPKQQLGSPSYELFKSKGFYRSSMIAVEREYNWVDIESWFTSDNGIFSVDTSLGLDVLLVDAGGLGTNFIWVAHSTTSGLNYVMPTPFGEFIWPFPPGDDGYVTLYVGNEVATDGGKIQPPPSPIEDKAPLQIPTNYVKTAGVWQTPIVV